MARWTIITNNNDAHYVIFTCLTSFVKMQRNILRWHILCFCAHNCVFIIYYTVTSCRINCYKFQYFQSWRLYAIYQKFLHHATLHFPISHNCTSKSYLSKNDAASDVSVVLSLVRWSLQSSSTASQLQTIKIYK